MIKNLGMLLLGVYLMATGAMPVLGLSFVSMGIVLGVLAMAAGSFILIGR